MACGPDEDVDAVVVVVTIFKDEDPPPPPPEPFFLCAFFCTTTGTGGAENELNSLTGDWKVAAGELDRVAELGGVDEDDLLDVDTSWTSTAGLIEKLACRLPVRELDGELSVDVDNAWATAVLDREVVEGRRWCSLLVRGGWLGRPEVLVYPEVRGRCGPSIEFTKDMLLEWWLWRSSLSEPCSI